jgi:aminopeptidase
MPLAHDGNIIDGFAFDVKDGKIVGISAKKGEDILKAAISVDEGASYFGEIALVQYDSPISRSGILYYNTLFDENASCHLAFGRAYPLITGSESMTEEQLAALGVNNSITHVDFMVGTPDLEITGTRRDGGTERIFVEGNFVF